MKSIALLYVTPIISWEKGKSWSVRYWQYHARHLKVVMGSFCRFGDLFKDVFISLYNGHLWLWWAPVKSKLIINPGITKPKIINRYLGHFPSLTIFFITEIFRMRKIFVLGLLGSMVRRGLAEDPMLVYNQSIYTYLFDGSHPNFGVYNKNSPPLRKDDMTRYYDGMEIFQHSIDKFVDHHCDPYINFLESKYLTLQSHWLQLRPVMISLIGHHFFVSVTEQGPVL